jgi:AcrR family transcriptional regulator
MAAPRTTTSSRPAGRRAHERTDESAPQVVRRAPFAENPHVGPRGQRTQQRILDAALRAFSDDGYHRTSIDRIAQLSGCSRVAVYQYFSSKDDVFRELAAQVARQLTSSTEALDPVTATADGWSALRRWAGRYADIYARYQPVFNAYQAAVEDRDTLAAVRGHAGEQNVARIHSRVSGATLPPRRLDAVIALLIECMTHTLDMSGILYSVVPTSAPPEAVVDAITDVAHRTLFGLDVAVNAHTSAPPARPDAPRVPEAWRELDRTAPAPEPSAYTALLQAGRDVFVARGYHNTRVDDLIGAAGVSRGAFYRYFRDKDQLARLLVAHAERETGAMLGALPPLDVLRGDPGGRALPRWLRRYNAVHLHEAAMLRVWVDGAAQDPALRPELAPSLDWGRRRMRAYLAPRGFGDVELDAVVLIALLGVFGARRRGAVEVEAAAHIIERGLLGTEGTR